MSVSTMKRLTALIHKQDVDRLLDRLIRLRCVEVIAEEPLSEQTPLSERYRKEDACQAEDETVARIGEAMAVLNRYSEETRGLFRSRAAVDIGQFCADGSEERARKTVEEALLLQDRIAELRTEENRLRLEILALMPYERYDLPVGVTGTEHTELRLGAFPSALPLDTVGRELYAAGAVMEVICCDESGKYAAVVCCRSDSPVIDGILTRFDFVRADLTEVERTPAEQLNDVRRALVENERRCEQLEERLRELARSLSAVETLYDLRQTARTAVIAGQRLLTTESAVLLSAWVPEHAESRVIDRLEQYACAYELRAPNADENPPILLKNNGFASNFEWVLGMYSYPAYGSFDPTLLMSIFYCIIFGIMFADAGYGLLLMLAGFGGVRLLKPKKSMRQFLTMFGYCGIFCVIGGVLFGAYFGDLPIAVMKNMMGIPEADLPNLALLGSSAANVAVLFDPLQNPMGFLIVSLGVGAVHLIAGMAVKFVLLCKEGHALDAVLDIGAYWLLFAGLGLIFLAPTVGIWVTVGAAALIVLTHGRSEKNPVMKLLKGFLGIYDLINYASDLLSYSRILALGLAAGVISQVINILGTMGGATVVGFLGLVIAFAVGHLLNLAINVLGTFVHTSRLQYIEFFNKFYEDGGVAFEPMTPSEQYTEEV